ncbi:Disheveled-associated activator of morphogenesis 1 [Galdieria sulphuraria]|nr:Disheveled-associated activator of morphogenesis 1 [Galdieria sulphuraria]
MPGMRPSRVIVPLEEKSLELEVSNVQSRNDVTTRRIHWHKIPMNRLKDSIWQETQAITWKVDESEIKAIFQLQLEQTNFSVQQSSGIYGEAVQQVTFLDDRYARNLEILMGRFRNLGGEKVKELILNGDCSSVTKMDEFLPLLSSLVPSSDVQQQLLDKAKNVDLTTVSPPERFLLTLCEVPRCSQKVQSILFKLMFQETSDKVLHDLEALMQGAKEICQSNGLKEIVSLSLSIGNVLNAHHPQGNAKGYSIEDINIFNGVRSSRFSRVTLLNYMISILKRNMPQVLSFADELPSLRLCAFLDSDNVLAQFEGLEHDMQQMHTEICRSLEESCSMPFGEMMMPWYEKAQRTMENLRTMIHTWQENMEDVILYLPSVDTAACYNSVFQHLYRFVSDFQRAWDETEQLQVLQRTGIQFARVKTQPQQVHERLEVHNVYKSLETLPMTTPPSPPPPPPPPPPLSVQFSSLSSMPSFSVVTSIQ